MLVSFFVLLTLVPIAYVMWCAWWLVVSLGDQVTPGLPSSSGPGIAPRVRGSPSPGRGKEHSRMMEPTRTGHLILCTAGTAASPLTSEGGLRVLSHPADLTRCPRSPGKATATPTAAAVDSGAAR